ncbi:hypothetical protein D3C74_189980 [compost metagenome]
MSSDAFDMTLLVEVDLKEIILNEGTLQNSHIKKLLLQYKETVLTTIISQFGLGPIFDSYKNGGNVTTLHNAEKGIFANKADEDQYTEAFDRGNYEKDFPKKRKLNFQTSIEITDDYTGKVLKKDGTTHLDHVISAKAIHSNNGARLYMNAEQRDEMATSERNLAWTDSSLNQSKNDKDLEQWMDRENKRSPGKTNAQHYEINREAAVKKNIEACKVDRKESRNKIFCIQLGVYRGGPRSAIRAETGSGYVHL